MSIQKRVEKMELAYTERLAEAFNRLVDALIGEVGAELIKSGGTSAEAQATFNRAFSVLSEDDRSVLALHYNEKTRSM